MGTCRWFFTRGDKRAATSVVQLGKDYWTALLVHGGSVGLASLTHIFTNGPHRLLAAVERFATGKATAGPTEADKAAGAACVFCMDHSTLCCVENLFKYTSPNAYTAMAMFGTPYWASAKTSFFLVIRNKERLGATMAVAQLVPVIGQVFATTSASTVFYFIQIWAFPSATPISMACSTLICGVTAWIMSRQFMAPISQAPSALLQCYMIDEEYAAAKGGLAQRFAEKELHAWVDTYGGEHATYTDMVL